MCRSFLTPDRTTKNYSHCLNYAPSVPKYYGRFNLGVTTINLADVAFSSKGNFTKFWKILEERCQITDYTLDGNVVRIYDHSGNPGELNKIFVENGLMVTKIKESEENLEEYFSKLIGGGGIA